jgi:hypothetical protein
VTGRGCVTGVSSADEQGYRPCQIFAAVFFDPKPLRTALPHPPGFLSTLRKPLTRRRLTGVLKYPLSK